MTSAARSLPEPPPPEELDPIIDPWPARTAFFRSHRPGYEATEFNPGTGPDRGRFHPFRSGGRIVPVLYGGETLRGSTSETVFHDVAVRGPDKRVMRRRIMHYVASKLIPLRELRLARLHSTGLRRLGVTRGELIEAEADQYADTAKWAQALHACPARPDGLIWVSRQDDSTKALVLFGDRVNRRDLEPDEEALALGFGVGFDEVCRIALESDITVVME